VTLIFLSLSAQIEMFTGREFNVSMNTKNIISVIESIRLMKLIFDILSRNYSHDDENSSPKTNIVNSHSVVERTLT
jgi:hypothetical protein